MTRVNVDDIAFMDRRFKLLGGRLAMSWQEALGRCLPVWALAYAKRTAILTAGDIDALAERQGFAAAMLEVDLAAEAENDVGLYVRGVAARIDFLLIQDAKRDKARQARLAAAGVSLPPGPSPGKRASSGPPGPSPGTSTTAPPDPRDRSPGTIPQGGSYSPDLDQDLDQDLDPASPVLPDSIARAELRRKFIWSAWELAGNAFRELGREGVEPTAPDGYAGMPNAGSEGMKRLGKIADLLLIGDQPDIESALATVRRRVEVAKIQGRVRSTRKYLAPMWMWKADSFEIDASQSPEQATAQARAGPQRNGRPPEDPPRKIKTL